VQGGYFVLVVTHDTLGEVERSPELLDKQAAFDWVVNSDYIKFVDQASLNDPAVVAATSLSGGTDDRVNITETHWTNALVRFTRDLGPGQVSAPGRTTGAAHTALLSHAAANNRVAIIDPTDTNVKATLQSILDAQRGANAKWGAVYGRWLKSPGAVPGTTRTIPPSALVSGLIAYADAIGGSPNTPAAGENGIANYITGLSGDPLTDADRESLNAQGFNSIISKYGTMRVYGWRSLAHPDSDKAWINFANSRLVMEIAAKADIIGESFLFDEIDGQGRKISEFGAALTSMLMPYWEIGSLYGLTPTDAFVVDVGPSVNTPTTIANLELRAKLQLRPSPFAEMITIHIVKTSISEPVA
jgi:phage tail sheath protein FI